jgi:hypothetical protein
MASYLPPTEDLPIFDNQSFTQNNVALTYAEAKKYFVTFPTAQGTTTITDLIAGEIEYSSPSSGSFFDIGTNQVSGGTVRVGPTGGSSGVSVHAGNFDFKNNTLNNATASNTGGISICDAQTSGILNIATNAARSAAVNINNTVGTTATVNIGTSSTSVVCSNINLDGNSINSVSTGSTLTIGNTGIGGSINIGNNSARTGNININTTSGSTAEVTIGTAATPVTINGTVTLGENTTSSVFNGALTLGETSTTSSLRGTVNIGTTLLPTTVLGPLTSNEGISLASSKYITTSHSGTITLPTSTQVGGTVSGISISTTVPSSGNISSMSSITLTQGVWIINASRLLDSTSGTTRVLIGLGTNLRTNSSNSSSDFTYGIASSGINSSGSTYYEVNGIASLTGSSTTIYYNMEMTYTTPTPTAAITRSIFTAVRIA